MATKMTAGNKKPMHGAQNAAKVKAAGGKPAAKPAQRTGTMGKQSAPAYGAQATIKIKAAKKK